MCVCTLRIIGLTTGCSDGTREGFFQNPDIAACVGLFARRISLRAPPSAIGKNATAVYVTVVRDILMWTM